jgi:hypothetical protein
MDDMVLLGSEETIKVTKSMDVFERPERSNKTLEDVDSYTEGFSLLNQTRTLTADQISLIPISNKAF